MWGALRVHIIIIIAQETHLAMWIGHQDRLSHVQMSPDGMALCTSSWDGTLAVSNQDLHLVSQVFTVIVRYGRNTEFIFNPANHE